MPVDRIQTLIDLLGHEPDDVFLNYALGLEYAVQGAFEKAEQQYLKTIALDAAYVAVYYQLGKLFESRNQNEKAIQYYRNGLEKARLKKDQKAAGEFEEALFLLED